MCFPSHIFTYPKGVQMSLVWLHKCHILYLFILFMWFSRQGYWSGFPYPPPKDHILSEFSTLTHLSPCPCTAWLIASLSYTSPFTVTRLWSMKGCERARKNKDKNEHMHKLYLYNSIDFGNFFSVKDSIFLSFPPKKRGKEMLEWLLITALSPFAEMLASTTLCSLSILLLITKLERT